MVPYSVARNLITMAVMDATTDDKMVVYVKGLEKRERSCRICTWVKRNRNSMLKISRRLWRYRIFVMRLDLNLNVTNTVRCGKHVKNCVLQNVFKIYNWWLQCQK